jgi:polysaccharide biosynthesis/export protein PslD
VAVGMAEVIMVVVMAAALFRRFIRASPSMVVIFLLIPVLGCQTARPAKTPLEMSSEIASAPEPKLILGAGDVLDFKFFYNPELNDSQTVRFDGKISLQLIGEVMAQGKAPIELQE